MQNQEEEEGDFPNVFVLTPTLPFVDELFYLLRMQN